MPKPHHATYVGTSTVRGRVLIGTAVLAVLTALAGVLAYFARDEPTAPGPRHSPTASAASSPPQSATPEPSSAVPAPPKTDDPVAFGKVAADVLWSYDTRATPQSGYLAGLKRWMVREGEYADWDSVISQVPSRGLWSRMRANHQRATAEVSEGHFPQSFKRALAADPGAITEAYVYAVTVTGKQAIAWQGSGAGAEPRSTTLAVQCRPEQPCALSGVLPRVAP